MKQSYKYFILTLLFVSVFSSTKLFAQQYDYLDVPQGYETLNITIKGDTTTDGKPKSLNRVYRLERNGLYLLNGAVTVGKNPTLRVFGAEGNGKLPMLIPAADLTGQAQRAFTLTANAHVKNVYVSGRDNLGNNTENSKNMFRLEQVGIKLVLENVFLEHEYQSFVRMNAKGQKLFIKNSILRNAGDMLNPTDLKFIDTRGLDQDTIFVQNTTMYTGTGRPFRSNGAIFQNLILDHVTFHQMEGGGNGGTGAVSITTTPVIDTRKVVNLSVTNCLFIDYLYNGDEVNTKTVNDTLDTPIFGFVPLASSTVPDASRKINISNNAFGMSQAILDYYKSMDTLRAGVLLNKYSINTFFNPNPTTWKQKNNIQENVVFLDPNPTTELLKYIKHRRAAKFATETNNPPFWADRNGLGDLATNPGSFGPNTDEYNFDFAKTFKSYYSGEKGFPIGDLNWFPDMKKIWEAGGSVGIEKSNDVIVTEYSLEQNYPNPFNPTTMISFSLPKNSSVSLKIFNMLGQEVATLINDQIVSAGKYSVEWNGIDSAKITVATGVYVYQLQAGNTVISKKMMLVK